MRFLVSAGPTREMIDDVRFLSNGSSGRTGYAVAEAARARDHTVTLVTGPVSLNDPEGVEVIHVLSALEMQQAILEKHADCDVVVMTAAVCDYRPTKRHAGKLKKTDGDLNIELVRNPDILNDLGPSKGGRIHVGFALEVQDPERHALAKLNQKNLDLVVLNGPGNMGSSVSSFRLVSHDGIEDNVSVSKSELGMILVQKAEELKSLK